MHPRELQEAAIGRRFAVHTAMIYLAILSPAAVFALTGGTASAALMALTMSGSAVTVCRLFERLFEA